MNILLTCAGRRHYLATYFREALKGTGLLIGADMDLTAPALASCDLSFQVPPVSEPDYIDHIIDIIISNNVRMVFPLSDLEVSLFSESRTRVERETGAVVFVPDNDTTQICVDKWHTYFFQRNAVFPLFLLLYLQTMRYLLFDKKQIFLLS